MAWARLEIRVVSLLDGLCESVFWSNWIGTLIIGIFSRSWVGIFSCKPFSLGSSNFCPWLLIFRKVISTWARFLVRVLGLVPGPNGRPWIWTCMRDSIVVSRPWCVRSSKNTGLRSDSHCYFCPIVFGFDVVTRLKEEYFPGPGLFLLLKPVRLEVPILDILHLLLATYFRTTVWNVIIAGPRHVGVLVSFGIN